MVTLITNLKYKYYAIHYDEDNEIHTLVKKPYTIESIERVIDKEPKIISYKNLESLRKYYSDDFIYYTI